MGTLTVWKFGSWDGANQAIGTLEGLAKDGVIRVVDAASVSWQPEMRRPRTRQVRSLTGVGAVGGMFWGLLFGTVFLGPVAGVALGAAAGALAGSLVDVGIDDDFIESVRDQVTPGTSALFLLSSDEDTEKIRDTFRATGLRARLIQSNLSAEQEAAIHELFAD
ncbi:DUF1269 domain-containing protein [Kribbella jejuensis]|uniref:Putative membrane protein n=1 Tax=Kribbella jejuensis TaxID=236068 RepID=A0A542E9B1_9ACTN|nr:DUF1269 domain-containing protein [Kribbella jejuensis]TQJ11921.1 putative membrane protein [Kribbella jejuensis]